MDGVILELVGHVVGGGGSGVDGGQVALRIIHHDTGDETADAAESINSHAGGLEGGGGRGLRGGRCAKGRGEMVGVRKGVRKGVARGRGCRG